MASRGFEYAYMLDGTNATPVIRDWPMVADTAGYKKGDALVVDSNGRADKVGTASASVAFICQETDTSVTSDDTLKVAFVNPQQVWRCSMNASSTTIKKVYTKTIQFADENTISATATTSGAMTLIDTDTDDDGNVMAYVAFKCQLGGHS